MWLLHAWLQRRINKITCTHVHLYIQHMSVVFVKLIFSFEKKKKKLIWYRQKFMKFWNVSNTNVRRTDIVGSKTFCVSIKWHNKCERRNCQNPSQTSRECRRWLRRKFGGPCASTRVLNYQHARKVWWSRILRIQGPKLSTRRRSFRKYARQSNEHKQNKT